MIVRLSLFISLIFAVSQLQGSILFLDLGAGLVLSLNQVFFVDEEGKYTPDCEEVEHKSRVLVWQAGFDDGEEKNAKS